MAGDGKWLVVAFFEPPAAAEAVGRLLGRRLRRGASEGSVGVLTFDLRGRPVLQPLPGACRTCGVGAVLGALATALGGRVPPRTGPLFGSGSDLTTDDVARFAAELEAGQVLVAVLDGRREADWAVVALAESGGRAEMHRVTTRALRHAADISATGETARRGT